MSINPYEAPQVARNQPAPPPNFRLRIVRVLRDVLIIFGVVFSGGFVTLGIALLADFSRAQFNTALGVTMLLLFTIGFTISGCLAPPGRWRHLLCVAVVVYVTEVIYVVAFRGSARGLATTALWTLAAMIVGGWIVVPVCTTPSAAQVLR